ncbi:MAG TPA: retroviral-like aspartic protease family protein [Allosphingosinicella sp.]|nr:retroviral-like aspartic protease family protein [Allosphingosinicella sp.]
MVGNLRLWAAGAVLAAMTAPLLGQDQPVTGTRLPDQQQAETLDYRTDMTTRMTVPVNIGGEGPYRFVVDTGAERTVISSELARDLALGAGRDVMVHSMTEVSRIATVRIPGLQIGRRTVNNIEAPALAHRNLGAAGMLGVDSLQQQRVVFDFRREEMTITPSRRAERIWPEGSIVVTGRRLYGRLVLVDARVDGEPVWVIVDTGSQVTVANSALRERLRRRERLGTLYPIQLTSITGGTVQAEYGVTRLIKIGGVDIRDLPIAFADVHPFRQLHLTDRPALLLGMDALRLFDRVSVDFANRRVRILLPEDSQLIPDTRMAAAPGIARGR